MQEVLDKIVGMNEVQAMGVIQSELLEIFSKPVLVADTTEAEDMIKGISKFFHFGKSLTELLSDKAIQFLISYVVGMELSKAEALIRLAFTSPEEAVKKFFPEATDEEAYSVAYREKTGKNKNADKSSQSES